MPVEIKELVIRAVVSPDSGANRTNDNDMTSEKDAIVEACVKQVLRILRKVKDR